VHEITSFPTRKHDDEVDSITQGLALIREEIDEPEVIGYYRMLLEERGRGIYN
jgi:hypothetical protein